MGIGARLALCAALAASVVVSRHARADEPAFNRLPDAWAQARALGATERPTAPARPPARLDDPAPADRPGAPSASVVLVPRKSYAIPAAEIVGFEVLLNQFDRHVLGDDFASNASTIRRNLHSSWVVDRDPFSINQLGHPYAGSMYHGFARASGLDYWEALGYTFAGSALWEIAGERSLPSRNDQINTGIGGSFLGEILFRLANLTLEHENLPPFWREVAAAAISPPVGFNRAAFGDRFRTIFPSEGAAYFSQLRIGATYGVQNGRGASTTHVRRSEGQLVYSIDYGLPGKAGYAYRRPFDAFHLELTTTTANAVESLLTRGLLLGDDYEAGPDYRGVWGLYGIYDYIAPQTFRVSSTAVGLGTTGQWKISDEVALQGTVLGGVGYTAAGTTRSTSDRDYHYGLSPRALVAARLIFGERAALDVAAREYFISDIGAASRGGHDNILRLDAALTVRIAGRHGVSLRYLLNRRDASYPDVGNSSQTRGTIGLYYTYLGHDRFGFVGR